MNNTATQGAGVMISLKVFGAACDAPLLKIFNMNEVKNYTMTITDKICGGEVKREFMALKEYVKDNVERAFRNKKFREEVCRTFCFCIGADIVVTDEDGNIAGQGKFTHNAFSGRADYTFGTI